MALLKQTPVCDNVLGLRGPEEGSSNKELTKSLPRVYLGFAEPITLFSLGASVISTYLNIEGTSGQTSRFLPVAYQEFTHGKENEAIIVECGEKMRAEESVLRDRRIRRTYEPHWRNLRLRRFRLLH
jgi:hypothetical protein